MGKKERSAVVFVSVIAVMLCLVLALFACKNSKTTKNVNYVIRVSVPESLDRAYVRTSVTFSNVSDVPVDKAVFYIYPEFSSGENSSRVEISNVRAAENNLEYKVDGYLLTVDLGEPLECGASVTLDIGSTVIASIDSRFARTTSSGLKLFRFYPSLAYMGDDGFEVVEYSLIGDSFKDPLADFEVVWEYSEGTEIVSGGEASVADDGTIKFVVKDGRSVGAFIAKEGSVRVLSTGSVEIKTIGYDGTAQAVTDVFKRMVKVVGDYPYGCFTAVLDDNNMADCASGTVFLSKNADALEFAYGMAKQWFGNYIGANGYAEGWVADSLSEHFAVYSATDGEAYGATVAQSRSALETYKKAIARTYGDNYIIRADACVTDYKTRFAYDTVVRRGGSLMYAGLLSVVGEKKYCKCLASYVKTCGGKTIGGQEITERFSKSCGMDVSGIFGAYLNCAVK